MSVVTRQLHFWHLINEMNANARTKLTKEWWKGFHDHTHQERKRFLEPRGTNASTMIFWIHLNMTFFGLYTTRSVIMQSTKDFDGSLALKEIGMTLFLIATDTRRAAYEEDAESQEQIHKNVKPPEESIAVCGLSASQLDPRNQFLLSYCGDLLQLNQSANGEEFYTVSAPCKSLTNKFLNGKPGSNGHKSMFVGQPICFTINEDQTLGQKARVGLGKFLHRKLYIHIFKMSQNNGFLYFCLQDQIVRIRLHVMT